MKYAWIGLAVVGLISGAVFAQDAVAPAAPAQEAVTAPAAQDAVSSATYREITIVGRVSVVNNDDGTLKAIYINPAEGHGYKVDLQAGEGKTLADKHGKTVEASGVDANRMFNIKTIKVLD